MKVNVKKPVEVDLDKIIVEAGVRYWVDCKYSEDNGNTWIEAENDDDITDAEFKKHIPFIERKDIGYKESDYWCITIDINEGKVLNWPKGYCLNTWFKVCDDGLYQVIDIDGNVVWDSMKTGYYYVPGFLCIDDEGYGDYIDLTIDGEGYIKDWKTKGIRELKEYICND